MRRRPPAFTGLLLAAPLVASLAAGGARARAGSSGAPPALVEHVKRAVVVVNALDAKGRLLSQGSGFFIRQGRVVTNLHVVGRASRAEVLTFGGETLAVEGVVAFEGRRDLALLQVQNSTEGATTLAPAEFMPGEGEEVFVVSNPRGSLWEVSRGKALAPWVSPELGRLVEITAPVARGSSGGPVVNLRGQFVGVATMVLRRTSVDQFFAVPGEHVASLRPRNLMPFPLAAGE